MALDPKIFFNLLFTTHVCVLIQRPLCFTLYIIPSLLAALLSLLSAVIPP
jgi:hypothetical protein